MPYEATVPVHRRLLWPAVTDAERLIGALPNASIDAAGDQGVAGRLRVRTSGQTVTFRGVARIVEVVPASLRVLLEVEAVFGRGGGAVEGVVQITLRQSGSGTRVVVGGQLDLAPGASSVSAEALDGTLKRLVQRWFTALAATSPTQTSPAQSSTGMAGASDQPHGQQPASQLTAKPGDADPQQESGDPGAVPDGRPAQRTPLAVVRDLSDETAPQPEPHEQAETLERGDAREASEGLARVAASGPSGLSGRSPEPGDDLSEDQEDQVAEAMRPLESAESAPATAPLRLVTPALRESGNADQAAQHDESGVNSGHDELEAADPPDAIETTSPEEVDDIWSRLRERSLPPWIPFLVGAGTAALTALAVVVTALRRRYRR